MTIREAIDTADRLKPNAYSEEDKLRWLSELDNIVYTEIIRSHEGGKEAEFDGYKAGTKWETVLLIPEPYCECYLYYIFAKIDLLNGEYSAYNNRLASFDSIYKAFAAEYTRTHMPLSRPVIF